MKKILTFSMALFIIFGMIFSVSAINESKADSCIEIICKHTIDTDRKTAMGCKNVYDAYVGLTGLINTRNLTYGICTALGSLPKSGPIRITDSEFEKIGLKFDTGKSYNLDFVIKSISDKICEIMSSLMKQKELFCVKIFIEGFISALNE